METITILILVWTTCYVSETLKYITDKKGNEEKLKKRGTMLMIALLAAAIIKATTGAIDLIKLF